MLEDLREIPVINPLATELALYEMFGRIFRDNAESLSEILRKMTHALSIPCSEGRPSLERGPTIPTLLFAAAPKLL